MLCNRSGHPRHMWQEIFKEIVLLGGHSRAVAAGWSRYGSSCKSKCRDLNMKMLGSKFFILEIYNRYLGLLDSIRRVKWKSQPKESREISTECERGGWLGKRGSVGTIRTGRRCEVGLQVGKLKLQNCRLSFSTRGVTVQVKILSTFNYIIGVTCKNFTM